MYKHIEKEEKKLTDEELDKLIKALEYQSWSQNLFELSQASYMLKYQKSEIERLTEENEYLDMVAKQALADYQNTQVQVDELNKYKEFVDACKLGADIEIVMNRIKPYAILREKTHKQAVKDTAKEILHLIKSSEYVDSLKTISIWAVEKIFKERYGVEVE